MTILPLIWGQWQRLSRAMYILMTASSISSSVIFPELSKSRLSNVSFVAVHFRNPQQLNIRGRSSNRKAGEFGKSILMILLARWTDVKMERLVKIQISCTVNIQQWCFRHGKDSQFTMLTASYNFQQVNKTTLQSLIRSAKASRWNPNLIHLHQILSTTDGREYSPATKVTSMYLWVYQVFSRRSMALPVSSSTTQYLQL